MRLLNGFTLSAIAGAIWGAIAMLVIGVTLTLITGNVASPQVSMAAIVGGLTGSVAYWFQTQNPSLGQRAAAPLVCLFTLILLTFAHPFTLSLEVSTLWQLGGIAAFVAAVVWSCRATTYGLPRGELTRYEREMLYLRVAKGIGFVVFTIMVALPFYVMVMTSLKSQQSLLANPLDLSIDFSGGFYGLFRSYIELFTLFNFGDYLLTSAIVSVATVCLTLLFSVPGAYAVSRLKFPGRDWFSRSVLLIYMVPAIVLVIPLYAVFSQLGLRNSLVGLLIVYPATTIPVALYMLQGYFKGLPAELEEAGLMDGLSRIGVILKITLPLSLPALASVSLYVFMIAWNEFLFAFMFLDDPEIFTLSRGVVALNSSEVPRQHLMAGAVIATVPVLFIFLWFERFLVQGLTAGSVKG
ncbi:carbohydrate ABC transporter permease [Pseudovibrio exalbescens]|uniref:ABC transporter permease n=1 Tax=Pseudovibrio exalbescens TaxID=197461 RepID=A0A1U7JGG8_9HYPH|nr:carbohydrate ABC transporter permease [Pseudovibrio exalbescens]OKL43741.1 ABC transporter permease [Pseudovibrio exalbescens]